MSTPASAVTTVDSATTPASAVTTVDSATTIEQPVATPATPAFDAADQHTWSRGQREEWNKTGAQPTKADSATATTDEKKDQKDKAAPDSAPDKDKKNSADTASESATDKDQKPHLKTKEDTDRRFREILDENKTLQRRVESLERGKGSDTRDTKQASQPAAETYQPLDEKKFFADNPKAEYQDYLRASAKHEAKWEIRQELAAERQRNATEAAQKDLNSRVEEAKKRYPDYNERIDPAVKAITEDTQIPFPVKAIISDSPVITDLMYVLAEPKALADLIQTAKTNPAAAIRKIVLTEQLVMAELAKAKTNASKDGKDNADDGKGGDGTKRDESGKFVSSDGSEKDAASETKPRAPKPPSELGGRGTASDDVLETAAKKGDFRSFEAEQNRRLKARSA